MQSARCVPKLLGPDLKWTRLNMSRENLIIFLRQIPTVFFRDLWLWMRPGSITSNQRQSNNRGSPPPKSSRFIVESCQRSILPPGQCSGTYVHSGHGCYPEMWIPTGRRFGSFWLLPLPVNENGPRCHHFARYDDVMNAVDHFLRDQNGAFYTEGIRLLHDRWTKCVNIGGGLYWKMTAFDFLKLTPFTLGHGPINHVSYSTFQF